MRPEKESIVSEVKEQLDASQYLLLTDCCGLTVSGLAELRGELRAKNARLMVVKNTFLQKASEQLGWAGLDAVLTGPTAMVFGDGDVTEAAKTVASFAKQNKLPTLKGGMLGGKVLSADDAIEMSNIEPREVLLGMAVGTIAAPLTQLVGVMNQKVASLVYVLKAVEDKKAGA